MTVHFRRMRTRGGMRDSVNATTVLVENRALCGGEITSYDLREKSVRTLKSLNGIATWFDGMKGVNGRQLCEDCRAIRARAITPTVGS